MGEYSLKTSNLPTNSIAKELLNIMVDDDMFLPGDLLLPQNEWETGPDVTCTQMEVLPSPDYATQRANPEKWKGFDMKVRLTLHVTQDKNLIKQVSVAVCHLNRFLGQLFWWAHFMTQSFFWPVRVVVFKTIVLINTCALFAEVKCKVKGEMTHYLCLYPPS